MSNLSPRRVLRPMSQDYVQSYWCDFYDCYDQSDDKLDYDQMEYDFNQMEAIQKTESMNNGKLKWIENKNYQCIGIFFDGAHDLIWKQASSEIIAHVSRIPKVLRKNHCEIEVNELAYVF